MNLLYFCTLAILYYVMRGRKGTATSTFGYAFFTHSSALHHPHAPCDVLYFVSMLIGC